jgi:hypothetical protein
MSSIALSGEWTSTLGFDLYDPKTGESLPCQELTCTVPAGLTEVGLMIATKDAGTYHVEVKAGGAGGAGFQGANWMQSNVEQLSNLH